MIFGLIVTFTPIFATAFIISFMDSRTFFSDLELTELNLFTGMFDFSDQKQAAGIIGLQHQNDDLFRESFLGRLSPITGGFLTENNAFVNKKRVEDFCKGFIKEKLFSPWS